MSQWAKQQGESETWLCNLPVPPTACIAPGASHHITSHHLPPLPPLLSPPRLLLFLRAVSASGEGFSAAGSVRDTTNTDFAVSVQRENDAV